MESLFFILSFKKKIPFYGLGLGLVLGLVLGLGLLGFMAYLPLSVI